MNTKIAKIDVRHRSAETGNVVIYHLMGGGHDVFDLTNFALHVWPSGERFEIHRRIRQGAPSMAFTHNISRLLPGELTYNSLQFTLIS